MHPNHIPETLSDLSVGKAVWLQFLLRPQDVTLEMDGKLLKGLSVSCHQPNQK